MEFADNLQRGGLPEEAASGVTWIELDGRGCHALRIDAPDDRVVQLIVMDGCDSRASVVHCDVSANGSISASIEGPGRFLAIVQALDHRHRDRAVDVVMEIEHRAEPVPR